MNGNRTRRILMVIEPATEPNWRNMSRRGKRFSPIIRWICDTSPVLSFSWAESSIQ